MAKKKTIVVKNKDSKSRTKVIPTKPSNVTHDIVFSEETKRKILLFDKFTNGFIGTLEEFKIQCKIKKMLYVKDFANYLQFLNDNLLAYRNAISFMMENDPTRGKEYKKIITFTDKELKASLKAENTNADKGVLLDLSDASAVEKLIFLNELGVLEFLRKQAPFINSTNSLASVLSAITSEKIKTLQPSLNAMFSDSVNKKNDPYKTHKTVLRVKDKLVNIGFTVK